MSAAQVQSAWKKPAPWGKPPTAPLVAPLSLADIQRQEQEKADAAMAIKLQREFERQARGEPEEEEDIPPELLEEGDASPVASASAASSTPTTATTTATATATTTTTSTTNTAPAAAETVVDEDLALAMMLQAQYDEEYDEHVYERERRANLTNGNVKISMDKYRAYPHGGRDFFQLPPRPAQDTRNEQEVDDEEEFYAQGRHLPEAQATYDKGTRTHRMAGGEVVTKHNSALDSHRNKTRVTESFPLSFKAGDLTGKSNLSMPSKVYNSLQRFANKHERQQARLHEKKEHSTAVLAMDQNTRLIMYKLLNSGAVDVINGCVSTGKESIIFHGKAHTDPENPESPVVECALKVFKTTLTEFKQRQQFLHGDRRFEARIGGQSARKLVKLWTEKEMANLTRMHRAGLACPQVFFHKKHVLVMTFIGTDGTPAPKLKEANLSLEELQQCYDQLRADMATMYNVCQLVHCDLSEYNVLWHDGHAWIIDVGQSVDPKHPRATEFLFRDCANVTAFFERQGVPGLLTPAELVKEIAGIALTPEQATEYSCKVNNPQKKGLKLADKMADEEDSSAICINFDALSTENKRILLGEDIDEGELALEDEEDEEGEGEEGEIDIEEIEAIEGELDGIIAACKPCEDHLEEEYRED